MMRGIYQEPGWRYALRAAFRGFFRGCACAGWALLCFFIFGPVNLFAQGLPPAVASGKTAKPQAVADLTQSRDEFVRLNAAYKLSLQQLLAVYQDNARQAEAQSVRVNDLFQRGLVSRRDLTANEAAAAEAKAKIQELQQQLSAADAQVADLLVEADAIEQMANAPAPLPVRGRLTVGSSFIRYSGTGGWSLADAWKIQAFFRQRFGRPLPISTFGQSKLHDMWGWDHRNAMDIGLHPNSVEGQALQAYLRSNGIPFGAFTVAIPGVATGPHIHIGLPSHHIKPK